MPCETYAERVGANVRAEMARSRRPQSYLATHLRMSQQAFSRRLNGHVAFKVDELHTVAQLLGVPAALLLEGAA